MDGAGAGLVNLLWFYFPLFPSKMPAWCWAAGSQGFSVLTGPSADVQLCNSHRKPASHHTAFLVSFKFLQFIIQANK